MFIYEHNVKYYETDQMGVVHHSNYIRWFEEARVEFMRAIGLPYKEMEAQGVQVPVVSVSCKYKSPAKFDDTIVIETTVKKYNGIIVELAYKVMEKESRTVLVTGESSHCFVDDQTFKPISLTMKRPDMHEHFLAGMEKEDLCKLSAAEK